jgi:hypothetical protein
MLYMLKLSNDLIALLECLKLQEMKQIKQKTIFLKATRAIVLLVVE